MSTVLTAIAITITAVGLFIAIIQLGLHGVNTRIDRLEQDWREERAERLRQQKEIADLKVEVEILKRTLEPGHIQRCPPKN